MASQHETAITVEPRPATPLDRDIRSLQYGRGLAALAVCCFHIDVLTTKYYGPTWEGRLMRAGHSGVEFFFVLSALIIVTAHRADLGRPARVRRFAVKRLIRLLPMLWLVLLPVGMAYLLVPALDVERALTLPKLALDMLLVPRAGVLTLTPAWTLQHEALFYAFFLLAIMNTRWGFAVFMIWQVTCGIVLALDLIPQDYLLPASTVFGFYNFGFAFGLVLAVVGQDRRIERHRLLGYGLGVVGCCCVVGLFAAESRFGAPVLGTPGKSTLAYFVAYSLVITGLLAVPNVPRPSLDRTLGLLGAASYTVYLVHLPVGSLVMKALTRPAFAFVDGPHVAFWAGTVAAVAVGVTVHVAVERPALRWLRTSLLPGDPIPTPRA